MAQAGSDGGKEVEYKFVVVDLWFFRFGFFSRHRLGPFGRVFSQMLLRALEDNVAQRSQLPVGSLEEFCQTPPLEGSPGYPCDQEGRKTRLTKSCLGSCLVTVRLGAR